MTIFEHSFALIGLVLGLALAEVLTGLVRNGRARGVRALGILTPLLAIHFVADVATFWGLLWSLRSTLPESIWPVLGFSVLLSSAYYTAAALVFPDSPERWPDLDAYYMAHRRLILGLMLFCFVSVIALREGLQGEFSVDWVVATYPIILVLTLLAPTKWASMLGLGALIINDIWAFLPA